MKQSMLSVTYYSMLSDHDLQCTKKCTSSIRRFSRILDQHLGAKQDLETETTEFIALTIHQCTKMQILTLNDDVMEKIFTKVINEMRKREKESSQS